MRRDNSIVVLESSIANEDPAEIVWSNIDFVNALLEEYLTEEEISVDALRSYYVDYYLSQFNNGGFSQFVYNSRWNPVVVDFVRDGMRAMGARHHLAAFEYGVALVESFGAERLKEYFASEYFGDNADRDELNAPNDRISAASEAEDLVALNAIWLRQHPDLRSLQTVEQMKLEAIQLGQSLPDRARRVAAARANEPRYVKLIRVLCARAGQELDRITAGDPAGLHEGIPTIVWHFITDQGHHHMVEHNGKAAMYKGHSKTDRVCEIDVPGDIDHAN